MTSPAGLACAAVLSALSACGRDPAASPSPDATPAVSSGAFSWMPEAEGDRPDLVEEVHDSEAAWRDAWDRRRDVRDPAPAVDFARERVVVVAQHARHGGYRGARLLRVRREDGRAVVEYEAADPGPGVHAMVYRGYVGFYAVLPRDAGEPLFRRVPAK
jgi:hypothetical protein